MRIYFRTVRKRISKHSAGVVTFLMFVQSTLYILEVVRYWRLWPVIRLLSMACANVPDQTEVKEWRVQSYLEQHLRIWPQYGNRIMAQYDEDSIVVYQAFCHEIADYAVRYQKYVCSKLDTY